MSPDDPRHGSEAGDRAHRRDGEKVCARCLRGKMRAQKLRRMGRSTKVASLGSQRRIQALQAMGYSRLRIARELGYTDNGALAYLMTSETMTAALALRIATMYDRLSMTPPRGSGVAKAKTWAARNGFAPPLAWDDIDNDTAPVTTAADTAHYRADDLVAEWRWLESAGESIDQAARQLGVTVGAIEKALERVGKVSAA